jgi:hypothetical protein
MGMFDQYITDPPLSCPVCSAFLRGWQGKDGPNALVVWQQGIAEPLAQLVDPDFMLPDEELAEFRLPEEFTIYTSCCHERFFIYAECYATDGIWTRTELMTAENTKHQGQERRGDFKARMRWLSGKARRRGPVR